MTNATRATVWQAFYNPWGEPYSLSGTIENNLRFPGQFFLIETGLSYNWHRHYDPTTGRYTQADPLRFVDGPSVYAYVGASPYMWTDREGLDFLGILPVVEPVFVAKPGGAIDQSTNAVGDFSRNYGDMRRANTIGADKYFHCKANCEAAKRGEVGSSTACVVSDVREWFDQNVKGDSAEASGADQVANAYGRSVGSRSPSSCERVCSAFRPKGLPAVY
jgi:RHS repeat-associated protein